jgi:hypothetical protein
MSTRKYSTVTAQTVDSGESTSPVSNPDTESVLDPDLTDFCSRFHITPTIREFCDDEDGSNPDLCVSDWSSDIEEESELKKFTQALQRAQIIALKKENKNRRGKYSKNSKKTLKRRRQFREELDSKGFFSLDKYMAQKQSERAPEPDKVIVRLALREESEEGSDKTSELDQDTCTKSSVSDASEVESEGSLAGNTSVRRHLTHLARVESEESSGDDDGAGAYFLVIDDFWSSCCHV